MRNALGKCSVSVSHILTLLRFALLSLLAGMQLGSAVGQEQTLVSARPELCYAFRREIDVWTVCEGKRERIRLPFKVDRLVISADGTHLAYYTVPNKKRGARAHLVLVSLAPGFKAIDFEPGSPNRVLHSTCGTILEFQTVIDESRWASKLRWSGQARNLIAANPLEYPPSELFQCSSDRNVLAAWRDVPWNPQMPHPPPFGGELGILKDKSVLAKLSHIAPTFRVSPNGNFVSYSQNSWDEKTGLHTRLCVNELPDRTSCLENFIYEANSLSNSGEILPLVELDKGCGDSACLGIAYWRPGMSKPEIIQNEDSNDPQWILHQAAVSLREWTSTLVRSSSNPTH
jgi:hypothetical protein